MRAGVVAFVRSELPQQMNRPTRVAFRQRECSRKVSLASQVNRLDNVNCRNKRAISSNGRSCKVSLASQVDRFNNMSRRTKRTTPIMGSIPARGVFP